MTLQTSEIIFKYRPVWEIKAAFTILLSLHHFYKPSRQDRFPGKGLACVLTLLHIG